MTDSSEYKGIFEKTGRWKTSDRYRACLTEWWIYYTVVQSGGGKLTLNCNNFNHIRLGAREYGREPEGMPF